MTKLIEVDLSQPGIARATLNRPEKRNALNLVLLKELGTLLDRLAQESDRRVLILLGAGGLFSSGMDLQEAANPDLAEEIAREIRKVLLGLYRSPLVTLAGVQGAALAGGAGLLAACDLVVAAEGSHLGFPEIRRGLVAAQVAVFLKRQVGLRRMRELLLTGNLIDARRACEMGLVNRVVPLEQLQAALQQVADEILQGGPEAVKATKRLITELDSPSLEAELDIAMRYSRQASRSKEAAEGIASFLEKRPPNWL